MYTVAQKRNLKRLDMIIFIISFLSLIITSSILLIVTENNIRDIFIFQFIILIIVNLNSVFKLKNYSEKEKKTLTIFKNQNYALHNHSYNYNSLIKN